MIYARITIILSSNKQYYILAINRNSFRRQIRGKLESLSLNCSDFLVEYSIQLYLFASHELATIVRGRYAKFLERNQIWLCRSIYMKADFKRESSSKRVSLNCSRYISSICSTQFCYSTAFINADYGIALVKLTTIDSTIELNSKIAPVVQLAPSKRVLLNSF